MSGSLPVGPQSGFLNSFLSFLGGVSEATAPSNSVKAPVLPKYVPEVKNARMELPERVAVVEDSLRDGINEKKALEGKSLNGQNVSKEKYRSDQSILEDNVSESETVSVSVCVPDSSCDVPELPPVHVNTFQGSFLNKINMNVSQTGADDSKDYLSSGKEDCAAEQTSHIVVKESGGRKQPKSGRRMRTRNYQNKDTDEEKSQDSSSSSVDVHSKSELASTPIRQQSTRQAKQKVEQRRVANIKKGKRLLSLYTEVSDSSDTEVEVDVPSAKVSENEEYDSDKDPAWTPFEQSSAKRSFGSDNDDDHQLKRRRGRPPATTYTPQKTSTVASSYTPQTVITAPQKVIQKPSSDIPYIQKATPVPPTPTTSTTPATPLARKGLEELLPLYEGPPEPDSPHSFQKGDFVIERKDLTNCDSFPIWKIDSGRLLQKFEPVERNGRKLHQSMSVYSSWIDQIHYRFKAIEILVFSAQRGKEMVEVVEKYRPKPPMECGNVDVIKEKFNIYIQILVSQTLEPTFLSALFVEKDKYYMDPLNIIDEAISKCLLKVKSTLNWKDEFQKSVDQLPTYEAQDLSHSGHCQATNGSNCNAEKLLRFYGCVYHRDTLFVTEELEQVDAQEYEVGKGVLEFLPIYHGLQHFKMNLLKKCQIKVNEVKVDVEMEDHEVLDKCLLDQKWITELLDSLVNLVQSANA